MSLRRLVTAWRASWLARPDPAAPPGQAPDPPPTRQEPAGGQRGQARQRPQPRAGDPRQDSRTAAATAGASHPAFSQAALRRAWRQVRANGGGPGVDGMAIAAFEANLEVELARLREELTHGAYRPRPVSTVLIPKRNEGLRRLAIWTLRDRVAQRAVYETLEPIFEPEFLPCSHGFRPGRSVQSAVADVLAARDEGLRWVFDADIKDCFDTIDPDLLMGMVRKKVQDKVLLRLVEAWLQAEVLTAGGESRRAGAGQGGVLSPLLCNVYLHSFDLAVTGQGLRLVRYADDLVVLCRRRQEAMEADKRVEQALAALRLALNRHKTGVVNFDQGFKFLGVFFLRGEHFYL